MKNIKTIIGVSSALLAVISAFCDFKSIRALRDGYVTFLNKINGAAGFDITEVQVFTLAISVLAAAFALSLIYFAVTVMREKSRKRQIVEAVVLVLLLLAGKILCCRLLAPTELLIAVSKAESYEKIEKLAGKKFNNINAERSGYTALSLAVATRMDPRVIKTLIINGADTNVKIPGTEEPALIAFLSGISGQDKENIATVKAFLENGADPNAQTYTGVTALASATGPGADTEILQAIIDSGADINYQTIDPITGEKGVSVLMLATFDDNRPDVAKVLVENGADLKASTDSGVTMLISAASYDKNVELLKIIIKNGADVNAKTRRGTTALMSAARGNAGTEIIGILMTNGADPDIKDNKGNSASDYLKANNKMAKADKEKALKLLARRGR